MGADFTDRLAEAAGVPVLLAVAYAVFGYMLLRLRGAEDQAGVLLPAIVFAAAAGDGRDAVARAPWLPFAAGIARTTGASGRRGAGR